MSDVAVALNRFGLGARPDELPPANPRAWLIDQFARYDPRPPAIAAAPGRAQVARELADYLAAQRASRMEKRAASPVLAETASMAHPAARPRDRGAAAQKKRQAAQVAGRDNYVALVGARAQTALTTPTPFVERMVAFWSNHFAVSVEKVTVRGLAGVMENEAIRPHVLGRFADMVHAVERHPAMLMFLDQAQSVGPDSVFGQRIATRGVRKAGLNENLGREIMELHTLGVRTGYDQADVTEFARALTGWTVAGIGRGPGARLLGGDAAPGAFVFAPALHEPGARTIMGRRFDQQGEAQAQAVLDMLGAHPATATHIATKLARHFTGDTPPPALVRRLAAEFGRTGGDLPSLYKVLIASPEAWAQPAPMFRSPWDWSIGAMRAVGLTDITGAAATGLLNQLGQPVWKPGSPAGWEDIFATWAGPDAVMRRVEAANRLAERSADRDVRALAARLYPDAVSAMTQHALARAESPGQALALLLVSPEAMRR